MGEEESCSWVTRAKFSPTVYVRSGSSGLPSITYECRSDRRSDLVKERLIDESKRVYTGSGSSNEALHSGNYAQFTSVISDSEATKIGASSDSPKHSSPTKIDRRPGSEMKDSSSISPDSCTCKSSHMLVVSESQTVDFSFHPHVIMASNPVECSSSDSSVSFSYNTSRQRGHNQSPSLTLPSVSQTVHLSSKPDMGSRSNSPKYSDSFSSKSSSYHIQSLTQMLKETNFQNIDFSFHPGVSSTVNPENFGCCVWSVSNDKKGDRRLHYDENSISNPKKLDCCPWCVSMKKTEDPRLHYDASSISNPENSDNCVWCASGKKREDPRLYSDLSYISNTKNLDCTVWRSSSKKREDPTLHRDVSYISSPKILDSYARSGSSKKNMEQKSKPKKRSISPLPISILSDAFKEAKSISKGFSTPPRRSDESDKNVLLKHFSYSQRNPMPQVSHGKDFFKSRAKKETHWARYFNSGGVRVAAVETEEKWRVDLSELYLGARFASGAHSRLYHGRYKNQPVAVKIIRTPDEEEDGGMAARLEKQFARETTFLSYLSHRNVIKLAGACEKSPIFFIITEYLHGGSLRAFLRKLNHSPLPLDMLISIALDVARGMEYIHSQGVIHRDMKPENILFDHNFCVKIADFGVACEEAYCDELEDDAGTYRWMAPEMIKHRPYGRKVDVYSFGLLMWEMITGAIPYEDMSPVQAAFAVVNKNIRPVIPSDCSAALRILIEQCWSTFPEKRPEFREIVKFLEQFESDLASGEALEQIEKLTIQDHKKNWVEKLRPITKR